MSPALHPSNGNLRSIVFVLAAVGCFALMDAVLKTLSARYPALQIAALRGLTALPLVLLYIAWRGAWHTVLRIRWPLHVLRGVLGIVMLTLFTVGVRSLPLSAAYTLFFIAPLLITALSVPVLGEKVGPRRWTAIAIGFVGVMVVLRPTGDGLASLAGLAVLASALGYSVGAITVRVLARTDSTQSMVVWLMACIALGATLLALPDWRPIDPAHGWLIAGIGVAGALGQYTVTEAFRHGEASLIAPLEYTALLWGVALDFSLWGVLPDGVTWVGAAIIVLSGLYLLHRERVHTQQPEHP